MSRVAREPAAPVSPASPASTSPRTGSIRTAIVAGGGIAGIAAALRLAEAGVRVTLVETRKKLGGRATSFDDVRTGQRIDNCQHVALGCCVNYPDLLGRLGALDKVRWTREQYWITRGGVVSVVRPRLLPAPLHFSLSMLGAKFIGAADLLALARIGPAIIRCDRSRYRDITFAQFLRTHGQPQGLIDRFWSPVVVSACNLSCERVSAASALHVFQEGFFATTHAADMGVSTVPLLELYDRAEAVLTRAGGTLRLGTGVNKLWPRGIETTTGERLEADAVVCALPFERAREVVDADLRNRDARFAAMERMEHSPILGVHLVFDRAVMQLPHAVLVEAGTQWLFRKDEAGCVIHAVISAADEWMALDENAIVERVVADIRAYFPAAAGAVLLSGRPVKEKRATFAPTPNTEAHRPATVGPSGIILAGDYTDCGWPATMEGATRSGYTAAAAVLGRSAADLLVPAPAPGRLARWLGLRVGKSERMMVAAGAAARA
ncbi:MAG: hydroxysqualene dehydroxylase HpnE [Phycisphaerales bacterium]